MGLRWDDHHGDTAATLLEAALVVLIVLCLSVVWVMA